MGPLVAVSGIAVVSQAASIEHQAASRV
uniref:Uncharacterized protein n=1 Tax=Anguilla anguilla TaxID=7936 RepID=A0A0E9SZG9_ANGAN